MDAERNRRREEKQRPLTTFLIDLDGTVADSLPFLKQVYHRFLEHHHCAGNDAEFQFLNGKTLLEIASHLKKQYSLGPPPSILAAEYRKMIHDHYAAEVQPAAGVGSMLSNLSQKGHRLGLVTAAPEEIVIPFLQRNKIADFFEHVITGDEKTPGKPDPYLYQKALRLFGAEIDSVLAIEDSENGIRAAKLAGIDHRAVFGFEVRGPEPHFGQWADLPLILNAKIGHSDALEIFKVTTDLVLHINQETRHVDSVILKQIDLLWKSENEARTKKLNNELILALDGFFPLDRIECRFVEYKNYLAQKRQPSLYDTLKIEPLAVSGMIQIDGHTLFGKRANHLTDCAGFLELVPSGGINKDCLVSNVKIDFRKQLVKEFFEETGLPADMTMGIQPTCLIYSKQEKVWDIGMEISLSGSVESLRGRLKPTAEYPEFYFIKNSELARFAKENREVIVPTSIALLECVSRSKS